MERRGAEEQQQQQDEKAREANGKKQESEEGEVVEKKSEEGEPKRFYTPHNSLSLVCITRALAGELSDKAIEKGVRADTEPQLKPPPGTLTADVLAGECVLFAGIPFPAPSPVPSSTIRLAGRLRRLSEQNKVGLSSSSRLPILGNASKEIFARCLEAL